MGERRKSAGQMGGIRSEKTYFRRKNPKFKHCDPDTGLYPFVRLIEEGGEVY